MELTRKQEICDYYLSLNWKLLPVKIWWNTEKNKWEKNPVKGISFSTVNIKDYYAQFDVLDVGLLMEGMIAVDCDKCSQGVSGVTKDFLDTLNESSTRVFSTKSGNKQYLFKIKNGEVINNAQDIFGTKKVHQYAIDIRGKNGFSVIPPSTGYEWLNTNSVKELPKEILNIINGQKSIKDVRARPITPDIGNRHDWFMREAGSLFGKGFTLDRAVLHLCAINETLDEPLSNDDLVALIGRIHDAEKKTVSKNENIFEPSCHIDQYRRFLKDRGTQTTPEFSTGFEKLDRAIWGYNRGELHIVCGKPNAGKSLFMAIGTLTNAKNGSRPLIFSTETSANKLINRCLIHEYGIESVHFRNGQFTQAEIDLLRDRALTEFSKLPLIICDNMSLSIEDIEKTVKKYSPDMIFVDYFQRCKFGNDSHFCATEFAKRLKNIARDYNIPVIVGTQVNARKAWSKEKSSWVDMDVSSGDVRTTQGLWHEADISIILNTRRNPDSQQMGVKLQIDKARDADYITLYFKFDKNVLRYYPITREEYYAI